MANNITNIMFSSFSSVSSWHVRSFFGFALWPVLIKLCQPWYTGLPTHLVPIGGKCWTTLLEKIMLIVCLLFLKKKKKKMLGIEQRISFSYKQIDCYHFLIY